MNNVLDELDKLEAKANETLCVPYELQEALLDAYPALRAAVVAAKAWLKEHDEFYDSIAGARAKENLRSALRGL